MYDMYDNQYHQYPTQQRKQYRQARPPQSRKKGPPRHSYEFSSQDDYRQMDEEEYSPYDDGFTNERDNSYEDINERQSSSFTNKNRNQRLTPSMSSVSSNTIGLKTSDQAFQLTAKLVLDYLSPKVDQNATSYYIDLTDTIFLDAVIPESMRPEFVEAVAFRYESMMNGKNSTLNPLLTECVRLGLGQLDSFLLGGGVKMDDGRILVEVSYCLILNIMFYSILLIKTHPLSKIYGSFLIYRHLKLNTDHQVNLQLLIRWLVTSLTLQIKPLK